MPAGTPPRIRCERHSGPASRAFAIPRSSESFKIRVVGLSRVGRNTARPGEIIDRAAPVEIEFDGRKIRAQRGDTIASALYAAGTTTFSRSFKYHRPRGLLCASGHCPNCLVTVDGEPNVRACTRPINHGMKVKHQNAWPSLRWDILSILDRLHWLMPVGFYYKALHRPKLLWLLAREAIRNCRQSFT